MNGKEYRICASDTPSLLASEVTQLLSLGWELYGHPFVGEQNVCQALVKVNGLRVVALPEITQPEIETRFERPLRPPRPERPAVPATVRNIALFLVIAFSGALLADAMVFRTGFYGQYLEPVSSTGTYERILYAEVHRVSSGKKDVLVLGNSRIAEGFSAKIANEYKQDGYWFSNCAVPASSARPFYYFVRDVDPHRDRYSAIAVPIDDYNDVDSIDDPADELSEMWLVINRLRLSDILPYALSFQSWLPRFEALRGSTFKGMVFQRDLQEFIEHSRDRLKSAKDYREHGSDWLYAYGGNSPSLAGLSVDWTTHRATFPQGMPQDRQNGLCELMFQAPPQHGWMRAYQIRWLGALADLYRTSKTKVIFFQLPRNAAPRPTPLTHWHSTSIDEMRRRSWVSVVDHSVFEPLEKPELFFDYIHLNTAGRQVFSPLLAETVKARLR
jgi:hypothetical protein